MSIGRPSVVERYFWVLRLGVVGIVAGVAGWTASSLLGHALMGSGRTPRSRTVRAPGVARPPGLRPGAAAVQERNPFCSGCEPGGPRDPPSDPPGAQAPRLGDAELVATQVIAGDPGWTLAAVRFPGAGQLRMVGQGSRVAGAEITRVSATEVAFLRGDRAGVLRLLPGPPSTTSTAPPGSARASVGCPASIRPLGAGRFGIDRAMLLTLLQGMGGSSRDVAVAPLQRQGRLAGLRILRVRRGSLLHCLGLRARDQVTAVNHRQLDSPDVLLTLMAQLPSARHVTVSLVRQGRPRNLDFTIDS